MRLADMIGIGIVGTGSMAAERAGAFACMDGVGVTGICSRDLNKAEDVGSPFGAKAYDDYAAMLLDCHAVVICAPNYIHARLAEEALVAGKHVLVDYPLCTSMEDAEKLRLLSEKAGRVLMVGNTIIHEAMFKYLMKNRPKLGRMLSASSRVAFYSGEMAGSWYMDKDKIGPIFSGLHYHHIEYYRHLLGEVEWLLGQDQSTIDAGSLVGGVLVMGHEGGSVSTVQWYLSSTGDGGMPRGLWITGSDSSVTVVSHEAERSQVIWDNGGEGKTEVLQDDWGVSGSCRDFIDAIEGRRDHKTRLDSDIRTLRIGICAGEVAKRGEIVRLEGFHVRNGTTRVDCE